MPQGKSILSETSDDQQAEYFLRLLTQSRQRIEQRINDHQRAIATAEARGNAADVRRYRQKALVDERDRKTVADLIDNLRRRFPGRTPGEVRQVSRRAHRDF